MSSTELSDISMFPEKAQIWIVTQNLKCWRHMENLNLCNTNTIDPKAWSSLGNFWDVRSGSHTVQRLFFPMPQKRELLLTSLRSHTWQHLAWKSTSKNQTHWAGRSEPGHVWPWWWVLFFLGVKVHGPAGAMQFPKEVTWDIQVDPRDPVWKVPSS